MGKQKSIEQQLEELVSFHESGGGFGAPEAKEEHERKIQLLLHKQMQVVSNRNNNIAIAVTVHGI